MPAPNSLRLLLIDDHQDFTEAVKIYAQMQEWSLQIETDAREWRPGTRPPQIVLLDYGLSQGSLTNLNLWAEKLEQHQLLQVTWLLSGTHNPIRDAFIKDRKLRGFLRKPIDLGQLPRLALFHQATVAVPRLVSQSEGYPLDQLANQLGPAIDIIDVDTLEVQWSNQAAKDCPLTRHDRKILRLLEAEMCSDEERSSEQRLDWDEQKPAFRYTRLYPVGEKYWLTRDWRAGETIHDADLFEFENIADLTERLHAVTIYLARRHGITRLRLYKIAELPCCRAFEKDAPSPLVMPLYERGGGFEPDANTWLRTGFLASENEEARNALERANECVIEPVQRNAVGHVGCSDIEFGNAGTRALFPVRDKDGFAHALLAFDRRSDHLESLDREDKELAETALRFAGVFDGPLGEEEVVAMRGLLRDLGGRLLGWLRDDEQARERRWHEKISKLLRHALVERPQTRDADPFEGLSSVCNGLMSAWAEPEIAGRVWGLAPGSCQLDLAKISPLTGWYLALALGQDEWLPIAGAGEAFCAYRSQGGPLPLLPPHKQALKGEAWIPQPIQDFHSWHQTNAAPPDEAFFSVTLSNSIGSWLGVPMQLEGSVRALMVVHSPYRYHFTRLRCHLLKDAAQRLLPPLAAAVQESKVRGAFTAAVMHEVKNDAAVALRHCEWLGEHVRNQTGESGIEQRLDMLRHYLEGLEQLGRDFLDVLRPNGDAQSRYQDDIEYELSQRASVKPGAWLENQLRPWRWLYDDTPLEIQVDVADNEICLAAPMLLRRVSRVLLQNAFRHGEGRVEISLSTKQYGGRDCLALCIANPSYASVAMGLRGGAGVAQIGVASQARARVGLSNAGRLAKAVGGNLEVDHKECEPAGHNGTFEIEAMHRVFAHLLWPLDEFGSSNITVTERP